MMRPSLRALNGALISLLGACAAQPVHYYTLLPPAQSHVEPSPAHFRLEILPIELAAQVDRDELIVNEGGERLAVLDNERWAAPLTDEIHAALAEHLARRLGARGLGSELGHANDLPTLRVKLAVRRFESVPGQYALIEADWSLTSPGGAGKRSLQCGSLLRERVEKGYFSLVQGHRRLIQALGDQIAMAALGWTRTGAGLRTSGAEASAGQCPIAAG